MQKILVGENCFLDSTNDGFINWLAEIFGNSYNYYRQYLIENDDISHLRTDPKVVQKAIDNNYIIRQEVMGLFGSIEALKCKIIEIPDDVDWDIGFYKYTNREYVYERYRKWE